LDRLNYRYDKKVLILLEHVSSFSPFPTWENPILRRLEEF